MKAILENKVMLVTGAARGIGRALCEALCQAGARVVAGVRDEADVAALSGALGASALVLCCNVADAASVQAAFAALDARFGGLDALVNNAGVIEPIGLLADTDPQAWQRSLEVNVLGAYLCTRLALPRLQARGGGVIVNVTSGAALRAREGWSAYCTAKAGLAMLNAAIHEEYGPLGVQAISFAPGMVDTAMQDLIRGSGINPVSRTPRSTLLPAHWPARVIAWLASGRGQAFAGLNLHISHPELLRALAADGLNAPAPGAA